MGGSWVVHGIVLTRLPCSTAAIPPQPPWIVKPLAGIQAPDPGARCDPRNRTPLRGYKSWARRNLGGWKPRAQKKTCENL